MFTSRTESYFQTNDKLLKYTCIFMYIVCKPTRSSKDNCPPCKVILYVRAICNTPLLQQNL